MRLNLFAAVVAATSLAFAACGPTNIAGPAPGTTPVATAPANVKIEQALFAAEAAYNVAAHAYVSLDGTGSLPPTLKAQAKPKLLEAYQALLFARSAALKGDTVTALFQASQASNLAAAVKSLLPAQ